MSTKILLVDDRPENILALRSLIAANDVEVLAASSGNDALALLLDHDVALALVDVQMPEMSGIELARLMRLAERSRSIPIIFVTASQVSDRQIFEGYDKGAVDYLLKPLDPHVVRSKVRVFVDLDQKTKALKQKSEALEQKVLELEASHEAAEAANRVKSRFLANMSHEIRTPLGAVLGYADLLRYPSGSKEDRDNCIAAIARNGELLQKIIDDVLDLAKIEADRIDAEFADIELSDFLADVQGIHAHRTNSKNVTFKLEATGMLPRTFRSDSLRLKQILNNIISNAVKFTEQGSVCVRVTFTPEKNTGRLRFEIEDTGVGLSPSEAGRLFQPFMQADSSTTRRFGGTGLGLVISKRLAHLLGGDLVLTESRPGAGSCFAVYVDTGPVSENALVTADEILASQQRTRAGSLPPNIRLDGRRILVADDTPDNRLLIRRILLQAGASVDTVENGKEAVQKATTALYDAILMDIQMPVMDGYEATRQLRRSGFSNVIIALTAHAMKEELVRCMDAGCNLHLTKPIDSARLLLALRNMTSDEAKAKAAAKAAET